MTEELKPCPNPWCKHDHPLGIHTNPPLSYREAWQRIVCGYCGLRGPEAKTAVEAAAAWNTRAESAEPEPVAEGTMQCVYKVIDK